MDIRHLHLPKVCGLHCPTMALMAVVLLSAASTLRGADEQPTTGGSPAPSPPPAFRQADTVAVLTVSKAIDLITLKSLERRFKEAMDAGADAIVIELDTPGGRADAMLDICHLLKTDAPANTVAWVHPNAYSAGVVIALACREIVVSPNSVMGDAAVITALPGVGIVPLPEGERAKLEAPALAEVIASARRNGWDENLVQSFIAVGVELWMIEHVKTGNRAFVDRAEYLAVFGEEPPTQLTPVAPPAGGQQGSVQPFRTSFPMSSPQAGSAPDPEAIRRAIEDAQIRPPARKRLSEADRGEWRLLQQVISSDRLLTIGPEEAIYYGLATQQIANDEELQRFFGASTIIRYDRTWSELDVRFLTNPWVRGVLIVIFLIGLFGELAAPGFGAFGAAALVALLVLIGAPSLAGMAQWWDILLIIVGLVLIAVEIFVIPGFGVAGILGAIVLLVGLVGTFVTGDLSSPQGQDELGTGLIAVFTSLFAAGAGIWLLARQVGNILLLNRLVLKTELQSGLAASEAAGVLGAMQAPGHEVQVGDEGLAVTDLRPAGRARFGDRMLDVSSVGSFIDPGTPIRVVRVDKFVIEVEATSP